MRSCARRGDRGFGSGGSRSAGLEAYGRGEWGHHLSVWTTTARRRMLIKRMSLMNKQSGTRSVDMDLGWIDLNTATEDDLANIPWLGRDVARRLIEHRPFTNMDDVRKVPGI